MLNKVKQLQKLRRQSQELEAQLEQEVVEVTHKGVTVEISGNMRLRRLETAGKEDEVVKDAVNKALKAVQKQAAKKLRGQLGGLADLLGR